MSAFEWLGLLDDRTAFKVNPKAATALDTLCALLEQKLTYGPDERDMVCLHHIFGVRTRDGKEVGDVLCCSAIIREIMKIF